MSIVRNLHQNNKSCFQGRSGRVRQYRAFSLAELVVSIGILVLMLSLVGQVFHMTVRSTGQATALTDVTQNLRAFEQTLRDDLRGVMPGRSLMLMQGNSIRAYWTRDGREDDDNSNPADGYPHQPDPEREDANGHMILPRADILMFYTARKGASYLDASVTSNLQQVVYGHADVGQYVSAPNWTAAEPKYEFASAMTAAFSPTETEALPAQDWHLARRGTLLLETPAPANFGIGLPELIAAGMIPLVEGQRDAIGPFSYEAIVLRPMVGLGTDNPWFLPSIFQGVYLNPPWTLHERSRIDSSPPALLHDHGRFYGLGHHMLPNCASFKVEWALNPRSEFVAGRLDGLGEMLWFDPGDVGSSPNVSRDPLRAIELKIAELNSQANAPGLKPLERDRLRNTAKKLESLRDDRVCELDLTSFSPERCKGNNDPPGAFYSLAERFRGAGFPGASPMAWADPGGQPNLAIFTASRPRWRDFGGDPFPDVSDTVPDPMFPGALRITVDVFDAQQRLDKPVRHVMVIAIGE